MKRMAAWILVLVLVFSSCALADGKEDIPLKNGSNGSTVKEVQTKLAELGFLSGSADGIFGNGTEKAVKAFQEDLGIETTGIVDEETYNTLYESCITIEEEQFYANILNTLSSLKQIHINPDTIKLLGAVVMNPQSDNPRTIVYISSVGLNNHENEDYFWKDLNDYAIKAIYAKDCYTGHNGRMAVEQLDLSEIAYYESCAKYIPDLSPRSEISANR